MHCQELINCQVRTRVISVSYWLPYWPGFLVLIFMGTYFRGDRNDRISWVYIFADSPSKCCKNPQNCLKMTEFPKKNFFAGTNFREPCHDPQKLIPAKVNTNKVASTMIITLVRKDWSTNDTLGNRGRNNAIHCLKLKYFSDRFCIDNGSNDHLTNSKEFFFLYVSWRVERSKLQLVFGSYWMNTPAYKSQILQELQAGIRFLKWNVHLIVSDLLNVFTPK